MKEKKKSIIFDKDETIIEALSKALPDLSKKTIKQYIKFEMIEINGHRETNGNKIYPKDTKATIYFEEKKQNDFPLEILYEDDDLIAINKPCGLLSISNDKEKMVTAFRLVSDYLKTQNRNQKLFVVHRLDQETSGVLLFSKNLKLKEELQDSWNDIVKTREYVCAVEGKMKNSETITSYLTMNHFQKVYSTKNKEIGKLAITTYQTLDYNNEISLLKVNILTGRRNQIRVHMSEAGHTIIGDKKYGSKMNLIGRLALHASTLELIDPRTKKLLSIEAKVPKEIINLVKKQ